MAYRTIYTGAGTLGDLLIPAPVPGVPAGYNYQTGEVMPASQYMLPSNMLAVTFGDGTKGFLDPADGTYYDSQGNDVTGYVQNFGGAKVTGAASSGSIAAAEGISAPVPKSAAPALPPGPAPRVTTATASPAAAANLLSQSTYGIPNAVLAGGALFLIFALSMGGGRRR